MRRTCFETILKLQKKNKKIVFIGSDLGPGFMKHSKDKVPERFLWREFLNNLLSVSPLDLL